MNRPLSMKMYGILKIVLSTFLNNFNFKKDTKINNSLMETMPNLKSFRVVYNLNNK